MKLAGLTIKGRALLAAIDAGLLPETPDGCDDEPFERFWSLFCKELGYDPDARGTVDRLIDKLNDLRQQGKPVLDIDPEEEREKRYKNAQYRNLVLRSVATFCVGIILMAFLEATGLGGFLFGLALFLLGGLFFKCL